MSIYDPHTSAIWPAVQYNFEWREKALRSLTDSDKKFIEDNLPYSFSGCINIQLLSSRVIVTCSTPEHNQEEQQRILGERLEDLLRELEVVE